MGVFLLSIFHSDDSLPFTPEFLCKSKIKLLEKAPRLHAIVRVTMYLTIFGNCHHVKGDANKNWTPVLVDTYLKTINPNSYVT